MQHRRQMPSVKTWFFASHLLHNQSYRCCFGGLMAFVPLNAAEPSQLWVLNTDETGEKAKGDELQTRSPTTVCHWCLFASKRWNKRRRPFNKFELFWEMKKTKQKKNTKLIRLLDHFIYLIRVFNLVQTAMALNQVLRRTQEAPVAQMVQQVIQYLSDRRFKHFFLQHPKEN